MSMRPKRDITSEATVAGRESKKLKLHPSYNV